MFDHYSDINNDGKVDIYDVATFHELMDEDDRHNREQHTSTGHYSGSGSGSAIPFLVFLAIWAILKLFFALVT